MYEQHTEPPRSSEGRATRRLDVAPVGGTPSAHVPPHTDQRRVLAFVLIGLGIAMLFSNIRGLPFGQGRERTYSMDAELNGVTAAVVDIDWGRGSLQLGSDTGNDLVSGSVVARRPMILDVDRNDDGDEQIADVSIRDQATGWFGNGSSARSGTLTLNRQPEYRSLELDMGSGSSKLDLSELRIAELRLDGGSGSTVLQLPAQGTTEGEFELGSGSLNMTLPESMEARIEIDRGSGSFNPGDRLKLVEGDADDGVYETPGYADAQQRIDLEINGGSGSIVID